MGFLQDVQDMPNQYAYSRQFFDRYYRPEYTTIVVAGDVTAARRARWSKGTGASGSGAISPDIPVEPRQNAPRDNHVQWPSPTLPLAHIAFDRCAYSDTEKEPASLDLVASVGFSPNSELYQKLVIKDQKVDMLSACNRTAWIPNCSPCGAREESRGPGRGARRDPGHARRLQADACAAQRLDAVKKHIRYSFALRMNNSEAVAGIVARFVALRRTPETIDRLYDLYAALTPEDLQNAARKYLVDEGRTIVTLTGGSAE